jgi:hypothetical protein
LTNREKKCASEFKKSLAAKYGFMRIIDASKKLLSRVLQIKKALLHKRDIQRF